MATEAAPTESEAQRRSVSLRKVIAHAQPFKLTLDGKDSLSKRPILIGFAVMAAGLIITLLPMRLDQLSLGDLTDGAGHGYVPTLCFLAGDGCLAAGVWRALEAARNRPLERVVIFVLAAIAASLTGRCLRILLQLAALRDFYRPALFFTGQARAAAVGWGALLTLVLLAGFLAPATVGLANLVPSWAAKRVPAVRWLAERRLCLLWPLAALAIVVIVTQWVLPVPLAAAMGYRYLTPSGTAVTFSLRDLGPSAWTSLQVLFALPLVVLMWEGIESARACERLVRTSRGGQTRLLRALLRIDIRIVVGLVIIACGLLAVRQHDAVAGLAAVLLLTIVSLSSTGQLGRVARLSKGFERGVKRWQLPEDWRNVGRFSLILAVLVAPPLGLLARDLGTGAQSALWLPSDLSGFYFYWRGFNIVAVPSVTAAGLYGHIDSAIWIVCLVLAGLLLAGMLLQMSRKSFKEGFPAFWFLLRVGLVALLLAPLARLADQSAATTLLVGCALIAILVTQRSVWPVAAWSVVVPGAALALWSFALWRLTWLPAAALIGLTVILRFGYNAGELNTVSPFRSQRVAYFQSIALISIAMLALGHGAVAGYFDSEELSTVSDHVSLSIVAITWLIVLTARHAGDALKSAEKSAGEADEAGGEADEVPASWSWLLDPALRLVAFTGRVPELAALTDWAQRRDARRLALVTGPGGYGKTRLALELCDRGQRAGWTCVWIPPGAEPDAIRALRLAGIHRALLIIDGAETRAGLDQLVAPLAARDGDGLRVLLLARATGEWCRRIGAVSPQAHDLVTNATKEKLELSLTVRPDLTDSKIVTHGVRSIAEKLALRESSVEVQRRKDHQPQSILDLLAVALAATMTDAGLAETGTGTVQVDLRQRLTPLMRHEQQFWLERAGEAGLLALAQAPTPAELNQVVAVSCLMGADGAADAARLANRVVGIAESAQLDRWLDEICAASRSDADGFLRPRRLAELITIRELAASDRLVAACRTGATAQQALSAVSFLARATRDYTEAGPELSSWLTQLAAQPADPHAARALIVAAGFLPEPNAALAPAAITIIRRLLTDPVARHDPLARCYWHMGLSRWLGQTRAHAEAVVAADVAVTILRNLSAPVPGLVLCLENLADRLRAEGSLGRARSVLGNAVAHTRELVAEDPRSYRPWLGRLLIELDAVTSATERTVAFAQEAAALYRQATLTQPGLYEGDLGFALEVISERCRAAHRLADAMSAGSQAVVLYEQLLAEHRELYRSNLARALDNQGFCLSQAGWQAEALDSGQRAVREFDQLQRSRPGRFVAGHALALERLAGYYERSGKSGNAASARRRAAALRSSKKG